MSSTRIYVPDPSRYFALHVVGIMFLEWFNDAHEEKQEVVEQDSISLKEGKVETAHGSREHSLFSHNLYPTINPSCT